jgi:isocitrate dehydrogenase
MGMKNRAYAQEETTLRVGLEWFTLVSRSGLLTCELWCLDETRVKEFGLKKMWKSPNGTIRNILNGKLCGFVPSQFLFLRI